MTRSLLCVARMPSVSHVRSIRRPSASMAVRHTITCGPCSGSSWRAVNEKCVATSVLVQKILRPFTRNPPSTRCAATVLSVIEFPTPRSEVSDAQTTLPATTSRKNGSIRGSRVMRHMSAICAIGETCIWTASAVEPHPMARRS